MTLSTVASVALQLTGSGGGGSVGKTKFCLKNQVNNIVHINKWLLLLVVVVHQLVYYINIY